LFAANALLALELGQRPVGNQAIFNGQQRAQKQRKTTIFQAAGAVSAVLLNKTIPIYWSYEEMAADPSGGDLFSSIPTVAMLLDAAAFVLQAAAADMTAALRSIDHSRSAVDARNAVAEAGKVPLLLVDEFTAPYFADAAAPTHTDSALGAHGTCVTTDFHTLCKRCPSVVALLAACKTQIQRYIHRETSRRFIAYLT
jgi:hypothetical protein